MCSKGAVRCHLPRSLGIGNLRKAEIKGSAELWIWLHLRTHTQKKKKVTKPPKSLGVSKKKQFRRCSNQREFVHAKFIHCY